MLTNAGETLLLDYYASQVAAVGLLKATTLASAASSGATQISVNDPVPATSRIVIGTEKFKVTAVSGTGPYTLTLDGALTNAYSAGEPVGYSAAEDGTGFVEASWTGYARQTTSWNAATGGDPSYITNSTTIDFGDPDVDIDIGGVILVDSVGTVIGSDVLNAVVSAQAGVTEQLKFDPGTLRVELE